MAGASPRMLVTQSPQGRGRTDGRVHIRDVLYRLSYPRWLWWRARASNPPDLPCKGWLRPRARSPSGFGQGMVDAAGLEPATVASRATATALPRGVEPLFPG